MKQPRRPFETRVEVQIDRAFAESADIGVVIRAAKKALRHQGVDGPSELAILITGDEQIRRLNRAFLDVDAPTDVLSFQNEDEDGFVNPPGVPRYLGDVILSFPRAEDQAREAGHSVEAELQLLTVHGVLHLLGHDHAEPDQKTAMWAAQSEILNQMGVPIADPIPEQEE